MKLVGTLTKVTHKNGTELVFKATAALATGQPDELYALEGTDVEIKITGIQPELILGSDETALEEGVDTTE